MSVLVIGGDKLGNIKDYLKQNGFQTINHVTGRKKGDLKVDIPVNTDLVLILTDFIGHQLTKTIKGRVKEKEATVIYSKRSISYLDQNLKEFLKNKQ
ncbi:DUF2325 domain-containing protein [Clostridium sp. MSJ-4]|uniref:DUF2325 domain-containing protein n=1 Tax=Clostridium simiarum TaxID=2841506 RepID=A0ABS6F5X7_9CLOT|nr:MULTISPECIES: DUF2325 domain-containing protein [Clostridium]MBU5592912.1 DUF2325 domain-containing protein [Clostridium simiarum]